MISYLSLSLFLVIVSVCLEIRWWGAVHKLVEGTRSYLLGWTYFWSVWNVFPNIVEVKGEGMVPVILEKNNLPMSASAENFWKKKAIIFLEKIGTKHVCNSKAKAR